MPEPDRGTDRAGRRAKRFLSPSQKYEIWLQLVRQEVTIAEAATAHHVDRSTIMRIRTVAEEGHWRRWPSGSPACRRGSATTLELAKAEVARLSEALKEMAVRLTLVEGKDGWA